MLYIFSDESGRFNIPADKYYVRSFFLIEEENLRKLKFRFETIAHNKCNKDICWKKFRNELAILDALYTKGIEFEILINIVNTGQFTEKCTSTQEGSYKFIRNLQLGNYDKDFSTRDTARDTAIDIKKEIVNKVKAIYFMNFWEIFMFKNLKHCIPDDTDCFFIFNSPQMGKRDDYNLIIKSAGIDPQRVTYKNGKEDFGIGMSDIISGCIRELLSNPGDNLQAMEVYKKIKTKLVPTDGNFRNPSAIHFRGMDEEEQTRMNQLLS